MSIIRQVLLLFQEVAKVPSAFEDFDIDFLTICPMNKWAWTIYDLEEYSKLNVHQDHI